MEKRVTLKDIAQRCQVTPTLVSAVLNRRNGRIACSDERREEILKAASDLGYRPNLLARSIKEHQVPLVGIMLHLHEEYFREWGLHYLMKVLPALTFALNRRNLECIFIPYRDEAEQLRRAESLIGNGLLGGIITNIDPDENRNIGNLLRNSKLPYMILGRPADHQMLYHAYSVTDYGALLGDCAKNYRNIYLVSQESGKPIFCRLPLPDHYFWAAAHVSPSEEERHSMENCFLLMGKLIPDLLHNHHMNCARTIMVESPENRLEIPENQPYIIMDSVTSDTFFTSVANLLADWMQLHREPGQFAFRQSGGPELILQQKLI